MSSCGRRSRDTTHVSECKGYISRDRTHGKVCMCICLSRTRRFRCTKYHKISYLIRQLPRPPWSGPWPSSRAAVTSVLTHLIMNPEGELLIRIGHLSRITETIDCKSTYNLVSVPRILRYILATRCEKEGSIPIGGRNTLISPRVIN